LGVTETGCLEQKVLIHKHQQFAKDVLQTFKNHFMLIFTNTHRYKRLTENDANLHELAILKNSSRLLRVPSPFYFQKI